MLEKEARKYKTKRPRRARQRKAAQPCLPEYGASKVDDLLSAIGYGKISAKTDPCPACRRMGCKEALPRRNPRSRRVVKRVLGHRQPTPSSRSRASTICWYIAPSAAIRFAAKKSSDTSRAAKASRSTPRNVPTCRTCCMIADRKIEVEWATAAPSAEAYAVPLDDRYRRSTGNAGGDRRRHFGSEIRTSSTSKRERPTNAAPST